MESVEAVEAIEIGRGLGAPRVGWDVCGTGGGGGISMLEVDEGEAEQCASKVIPDMSVESL